MTSFAHSEPAWNIVPIGTDLRNEMLEGALRERAIRIQESRLQRERQEPTPTQAAGVETLRHLDCGMLLSEDEIELTTNVDCFREGDVAFCVEPRRLTFWGLRSGGLGSDPHDLIFRFANLPFEIEPESVRTKRNGRILTTRVNRRLSLRS